MLGVHVLGPGYGESIVIELPGGEVGVIDSFGTHYTGPPSLDFVRANYPGLAKLKFVAVTHPHADHCMGLSRFFDEYDVEEFWFFHSFVRSASMDLFKAMFENGTRDAVEQALDLPVGSVSLEILRLHKAVNERKKGIKRRCLMTDKVAQLCGGAVMARFLTPNDASQWRYNESLNTAVGSLLIDGPKLNPDWDQSGLPHNQASGAILLEYGQTRILLMADAEEDLWSDLIAEKGDNPLPKIHYIKGAHHGSANGYHAKIYACACDKNTVLVITPFNRHRYPLPSADGMALIRPHVKEVYCTNSAEACRSTGLAWQCEPTRPTPALPREWAAACRANPRLLSLLEAQQQKHPYVQGPGAVKVPRRWMRDCRTRPELIQLLCQPLRSGKVTGPRPGMNDEFRVSMSYDDKGNVVDRYIGWGVGHLAGA